MTIGGQLRSYATKLFPRSALFRSRLHRPLRQPQPQGQAQLQAPEPPLFTPSDAAFWAGFVAVYYSSLQWLSFPVSDMFLEWSAEKEFQNTLEELDRKKKSPEAYLTKLHSEIQTLKFVLSKREEMPAWEVKHYEREAAVLESRLNEWIQGQETAPVPQR